MTELEISEAGSVQFPVVRHAARAPLATLDAAVDRAAVAEGVDIATA